MTDDLDYTLSCLRRSVEEDFAWTLYPAGSAVLLAEVERLRAENGNVRAEAAGMEMEIFDLRAQMEQLGADMAELARVRAALNAEALDLVPALRMMQAIAEERAATEARIVEYLRRCANVAADMPVVAANFESVADCIERGEHREEGR